MPQQEFKFNVTGESVAEVIDRQKSMDKICKMDRETFGAVKALLDLDSPVLIALGTNGPELINDPSYGPMIKQALGIQ